MEPFDQDEEEVKEEDKEMWKEAFGEAAKEGIRPKVIRSGYSPTDKEVQEHLVNHLPFRAWCRHCVKGKAKGLPHRIKQLRIRRRKRYRWLALITCSCMISKRKAKKRVCQSWL